MTNIKRIRQAQARDSRARLVANLSQATKRLALTLSTLTLAYIALVLFLLATGSTF